MRIERNMIHHAFVPAKPPHHLDGIGLRLLHREVGKASWPLVSFIHTNQYVRSTQPHVSLGYLFTVP